MIQRNLVLISKNKFLSSRYCQSWPAQSFLCSEISSFPTLHEHSFGKDGSQKAVVLLQIYQSIVSCSLPGKRVSLGVCKRLAGLEGYNLLASNDPTRNWTCCLFTAAEGWAEIKEGGSIPLERVWSRGWAAPREKTWERRSVGCMLGWIHVAP